MMFCLARRAAVEVRLHGGFLMRGEPAQEVGPQEDLHVLAAFTGRRHCALHHPLVLHPPWRARCCVPRTGTAARMVSPGRRLRSIKIRRITSSGSDQSTICKAPDIRRLPADTSHQPPAFTRMRLFCHLAGVVTGPSGWRSGRVWPRRDPPPYPGGQGDPISGADHRAERGNRKRAEDIVRETILPAWRHPEVAGGGARPIRPWLFTMTRHIAIDTRRPGAPATVRRTPAGESRRDELATLADQLLAHADDWGSVRPSSGSSGDPTSAAGSPPGYSLRTRFATSIATSTCQRRVAA
jgi:hypothetical protein